VHLSGKRDRQAEKSAYITLYSDWLKIFYEIENTTDRIDVAQSGRTLETTGHVIENE